MLMPNLSLAFAELGAIPGYVHMIAELALAVAGGMMYFFKGRREDIDKTQTAQIDALERLLNTQKLELSDLLEKRAKVEAEYKALVGLDAQLMIEFAREGIMARNAQLERLLRIKGADIPPALKATEDTR